MIREHDRVVLLGHVEGAALEAGDVGTVVHVYASGQAYEVEYLSLDGNTVAVVKLDADRVRPVDARDVSHARVPA